MTRSPDQFWTNLARRYAAQPIADPTSYEAALARTTGYLHEADRVLEVGAGTSSTALRLAPLVSYYRSTDFSEGMVAVGREQAEAEGIASLDVALGGFGDGSLGDAQYDAVLAFNLLHLLPDLHGGLREVSGLLPKGGLFISKTPCLAGKFGLIRLVVGAMRLVGKAPYVNIFSGHWLEATIREAGFDLVETSSYPEGGRSRYIVARKL